MSSSVLKKKLKFLLDENVKKELLDFLKLQGFDAEFKPKGLTNGILAEFSNSEQRVLVTNDKHFSDSSKFPREKIFSVILFKIPQDKPESFLNALSMLLKEKSEPEDFEGYLILLDENKYDASPIPSDKNHEF